MVWKCSGDGKSSYPHHHHHTHTHRCIPWCSKNVEEQTGPTRSFTGPLLLPQWSHSYFEGGRVCAFGAPWSNSLDRLAPIALLILQQHPLSWAEEAVSMSESRSEPGSLPVWAWIWDLQVSWQEPEISWGQACVWDLIGSSPSQDLWVWVLV